jgi:hypothetical protein
VRPAHEYAGFFMDFYKWNEVGITGTLHSNKASVYIGNVLSRSKANRASSMSSSINYKDSFLSPNALPLCPGDCVGCFRVSS